VKYKLHTRERLVDYYQGVEHLMAKLKSPLLSQSLVKTFTIGVKEVNVKI